MLFKLVPPAMRSFDPGAILARVRILKYSRCQEADVRPVQRAFFSPDPDDIVPETLLYLASEGVSQLASRYSLRMSYGLQGCFRKLWLLSTAETALHCVCHDMALENGCLEAPSSWNHCIGRRKMESLGSFSNTQFPRQFR